MKTRIHLHAGVIAVLFALSAGFSTAFANATAHGGHDHAAMADSDAAAKAKAGYPLDTCVVSGEKLDGAGDMGPPVDYIHKEEGKPDRLVRLCCKGCIKDLKKDPATYLKKIDDAAAAKAKHPGM